MVIFKLFWEGFETQICGLKKLKTYSIRLNPRLTAERTVNRHRLAPNHGNQLEIELDVFCIIGPPQAENFGVLGALSNGNH